MEGETVPRGIKILDAEQIFAAALRVGRAIGLSESRACMAANDMALSATGIDLVRELKGAPNDAASCRLPIWPGADDVARYIAKRDRVTTGEIVGAVFPGNEDKYMRCRIGKLLSKQGWRGHRHRCAGGWTTTWERRLKLAPVGSDLLVTVERREARTAQTKGSGGQ